MNLDGQRARIGTIAQSTTRRITHRRTSRSGTARAGSKPIIGWLGVLALVGGALACSDSGTFGGNGDAALDGSGTGTVDTVAAADSQQTQADLATDTAIVCTVDPCIGNGGETLCGPVLNPCTGETELCTPCEDGQVCNLVTSACEVPRKTCEELDAKCGRVLNSCGAWVDCGGCPSGQRCDPESRECVGCEEVSVDIRCSDMGIECGRAWLGCGARTELTDCGGCGEGLVCNEDTSTELFVGYHICEPEDCKPPRTPEEIDQHCTAAGAECGFISDGCGGTVTCGKQSLCEDPALKCGVRGIPNRCTPPPRPSECLALGRECGPLTSQCTGLELNCGKCTGEGEICRSDNGRCCTPRRCGEGDLQGKCGRQLDDGCGKTINCLACGEGEVCSPGEDGVERACVSQSQCADFTAGEADDVCGHFDQGDGVTKIPCFCQDESKSLFCVKDGASVGPGDQGSCCANETPCPEQRKGGPCEVLNSCITGQEIDCCTGGLFCNTSNSTCQDCPGAGFAPALGGKCKRGCECNRGLVCTDGTGKKVSGATEGTCVEELDCAESGASGATDSKCSNGVSPSFPRWTGDPNGQTCSCKSSRACVNSAKNAEVKDSAVGVCLDTNICPRNNKVGDKCSTEASTDFPRWAGDPTGQTCGCAPGLYCDSGRCKKLKTCEDFTNHDGSNGATCSSGRLFDAGGGNMIPCDCNEGLVCVLNGKLVTSTQLGTCTPRLPCPAPRPGVSGSVCSISSNPAFPRWKDDEVGQTCNCDSGLTCAKDGAPVRSGELGTCKTNRDCEYYTTRLKNAICSRGTSPTFPRFDGDKTGRTCNCLDGRYCVAGDPPELVTGANTGKCADRIGCGDRGAGEPCSLQPSATFPRYLDDPTGQTCKCASGLFCLKDDAVVTEDNVGSCADPKSCNDLGAKGENGNSCSNGTSPAFKRWANDDIGQTCRCDGGLVCVSGGKEVGGKDSGKCTPTLSCASHGVTRVVGSKCSTSISNQFPRWLGDTVGQTCTCNSGINCVGGTCCKPQCGTAQCGSVTDSCGTINCGTCTGPYDKCESNKCECKREDDPCTDEDGNRRTDWVKDRCGDPYWCGEG